MRTTKAACVLILTIFAIFPSVVYSTDKTFIIRAGVSGLFHYKLYQETSIPKHIKLNKYGFGSTFQFGFISSKNKEIRHYLELNHINYSAEVDLLGSYSANKLFLSFSPFQYHIVLNPESKRQFSLEAGLTIGMNILAFYKYKFLDVEQKNLKMHDESSIAGLNIGLNMQKTHFNKNIEMGVKCRISPFLGVFIVDHHYLSTELFYGIMF